MLVSRLIRQQNLQILMKKCKKPEYKILERIRKIKEGKYRIWEQHSLNVQN